MEKYRRICAFIDLDAVEYNFEQMRQALTPGIQMIAVVKADAYGHGAVPIAALMEPKEYIWGFAVATTEEALRLRRHGIRKPILILGYVFPEDYPLLAEYEIRPAVFTLQMAEELSQAAQDAGKILPVHLAVDTGMTRIGFRNARESLADMVHISKMPGLFVEGIFTHFARADEQDVQWARKQYAEFSEYLRLLEQEGIRIPVRHCNNSAGILWHREGDLDAVRPGITIYGVYPSGEVIRNGVSLKPVMRLVSHISHIKEVEAGVPVSYGGTWVTTREKTRIATVPAGYADGVSRGLSNRGSVLIAGRRAPVLGRICMDQFMVDVTDIPEARLHDPVTLLGRDGREEIAVEELSELSGRFPYEYLCCVSGRVPRVYIKDGKEIEL